MSQKQFVLGLIEAELDREQAQRNGVTEDQQTEGIDTEEGLNGDPEAVDGTGGDGTDEEETEDEDETEGFGMSMGGMSMGGGMPSGGMPSGMPSGGMPSVMGGMGGR